MTDDLLRHALRYADRGWPVIPLHSPLDGRCDCRKVDCTSPAKHPRTAHGLTDATTDVDQIREWWTMWPTANVGLVIPDDKVVLDFDRQDVNAIVGKDRPLPTTALAETGKGWHFLYATDRPVRPAVAVLDGLDIRGPGSYIVAPPSVHVSGHVYTWTIAPKAEDIAPAPAWVYDLARPVTATTLEPGERIPSGKRNAELASLAGTMRRRGMDADEIEAALLVTNGKRCDPPLPDDEVRTIARSVARYDPPPVIDMTPASVRAVWVDDIDIPDEDPPMALAPLLLDEGPTVLFGMGETRKSILAQLVASSVATGQAFVPGWHPSITGPVLWLDYENSRRRFARRQRLIGSAQILYVPCARPIWDEVPYLADLVRSVGAVAIVVDSIIPASAGGAISTKDAETAGKYFAAVNAIAPRSLSIGHVSKDGESSMPFGSVFFHNLARLTWRTRADNLGRVTLTNEKHTDGDRLPATTLLLDFGDRLTVTHSSPQLTPALLGHLVGETGGTVGMTAVAKIVRESGYEPGRSWLRELVTRGVNEGHLVKLGRDRYEASTGLSTGLRALEVVK